LCKKYRTLHYTKPNQSIAGFFLLPIFPRFHQLFHSFSSFVIIKATEAQLLRQKLVVARTRNIEKPNK
jgi:hypothetical protein